MSSRASTGPHRPEALGSGGQVGGTAIAARGAAGAGGRAHGDPDPSGPAGAAGNAAEAPAGGRVGTVGLGAQPVTSARDMGRPAASSLEGNQRPADDAAVSLAALDAALDALATSRPSQHGGSAPTATTLSHQAVEPLPLETSDHSDVPTAVGAGASSAAPARLADRASRFSSLKRRLSPSSMAVSSGETVSQRQPFKRRFSRSLTSFQATLLPTSGDIMRDTSDADADADADADETSDGSKLAKWRAKGKAKLVGAFKLATRELPPCSPPGSSPATVRRTHSRSRSHSAPLFLPRDTSGAAGEPNQHYVPAASLTALYPVRRWSPAAAPTSPAAVLALEQVTCDSPVQSAFATCPSSPSPHDSAFASLPNASQLLAPPSPRPPLPVNHFDWLPRELQLRVFRAVIEVCEDDWRKEVRAGRWVGTRAAERWSDGRARGPREVINLGRVCKLWRALSLDGQLWATAPATSLLGGDTFTRDGLGALLQHARPFITTLDARGLGETVDSGSLSSLVYGPETGLRKIDLTGCTSLTSSTLSRLLALSPRLVELVVPGLPCVSTHHVGMLWMHCPRLARLDVSRCPSLTAYWLLNLPYAPPRSSSASPLPPSPQRGLKSLKASNLRGMDHLVLATLLQRHPGLETLDVSSCAQVQSDALHQAIANRPLPASSAGPSQVGVHGSTPLVSAPPPEQQVYHALRHLNLSGCKLITSGGLLRLAGALPNLEILELSRIGAALRAGGLAQLLASCTALRKLDLEDASEATDEVLLALVPSPRDSTGAPNLTHLLISGCKTFSDGAIAAIALERGCDRLRVLEADGTALSPRTAKAFVRLARERARVAQAAACARPGQADPLAARTCPAVLTVLDNRETGRSLSRDVGSAELLRPRNGQRGHWTRAVELYHGDDDDAVLGGAGAAAGRATGAGALRECDPSRVVVRSFYSNLAVDAARVARDAREAKERAPPGGAAKGPGALLRTRAMSDSEIVRHTRAADGADGRVGCVIA
ncbi:hypothetical protein JCM3770_001767 [Rhodotorula araucariae]